MTVPCLTLNFDEPSADLPYPTGMLFPPNKDGIMKLCSCRYVTNFVGGSSSVGRSSIDYPDDGIPDQIDQELRGFLKDVLPELSQRPWQLTRMCWYGSPSSTSSVSHLHLEGMLRQMTRTSGSALILNTKICILQPEEHFMVSNSCQQLANMWSR